MNIRNFDLAIIGGGPAGYNAAANASANGLQVVLFEHTALGGVCLNEGCIPTKTLLHAANLFEELHSSEAYGIHIDGAISARYEEIAKRKDKVVQSLTSGVAYKLKSAGVNVVQGTARLDGEEGELIRIVADGETYLASFVLLATGSTTVIPPIPGLDQVPLLDKPGGPLSHRASQGTSRSLGGGVIGMEFCRGSIHP